MKGGLAVAAVSGLLAAAPAAAASAVNIEFQDFAPSQVDVLPHEAVDWTNSSDRRHTVTADDGSFDSGDLFGGDNFSRRFDDVGVFTYHCTVHLGMTGEVDVRQVILDPVPPAAVPAGRPVAFSGRAVDGAPVTLEEDTGSGYRVVAPATRDASGVWHASFAPTVTADFRAVSGGAVSETRRLLVSDRRVRVRATRRGAQVVVSPPAPGAHVRLQVRRRERFGWWPSEPRRLDYLSRAEFRVRRPARVRAVLVDNDGWSALATSPVIRLHR